MLAGHQPRRHQGLPEHAQPAVRDHRCSPRETRVSGHHDLRLRCQPSPGAAPPGVNPQGSSRAPISIAIAKDTLFLTTRHDLARAGAPAGQPALAESAVVSDRRQGVPRKSQRHELRSPRRVGPALLRHGQERQIREGHPAGHRCPRRRLPKSPDLGKLIPAEKLPDFSVFAKYLSLGGGFSVMDDDGFTMTGFTLRKSRPIASLVRCEIHPRPRRERAAEPGDSGSPPFDPSSVARPRRDFLVPTSISGRGTPAVPNAILDHAPGRSPSAAFAPTTSRGSTSTCRSAS